MSSNQSRFFGKSPQISRNLAVLAALTASLGLYSCNSDSGSIQVGNDFITDAPNEQPAPLPTTEPSATATPTASPTAKPTVTPTTSPTVTPKPSPTVSPSPSPTAPAYNTTDLYIGDPALAKYVQKFIDDAKAQGIDVLPNMKGPKLEVRVQSLDSVGYSTIGLCEKSTTRRRVTFDPDFWNTNTETRREQLAHHELGHCVLNRRHLDTLLPSGAPASLMNSKVMKESTYVGNYKYYQLELFHPDSAANAQTESLMVAEDVDTVDVCTDNDAQ